MRPEVDVNVPPSSENAMRSIPINVGAQRDAWVRRLMDFSRRNRLIYYRELKRGTLNLAADFASVSMSKLISGETCALSAFFGPNPSQRETTAAKEIRSVARSNEEERGLQTLFVGIGFAQWTPDDDGNPPNAPLFLMPVSITIAQGTGEVALKRAGDLILNRVMLAIIEDEYGILVDTSFFDAEDAQESMGSLYDTLCSIHLAGVPGFSAAPKCVLGNFDYQKMAMVEDLRNNEQMLSENELVSAIAGDEEARKAIAESQRSISTTELDDIPAADEPFVLGADGSQQAVLHSTMRHPSHTVIHGPPGTGKSQTIANLIAGLISQGKRVLFVAEKRAALEVVYKRLSQVGLGHLILDLHGGDVKRKTIYERLRQSDEIARGTTAVDGTEEEAEFARQRATLNAYVRALHKKQSIFDLSAFEVYSQLAALRDIEVKTQWRGQAIRSFSRGRLTEASGHLSFLGIHADLLRRTPGVPWSEAIFTSDDGAEAALAALGELQGALSTLREESTTILSQVGLSAESTDDLVAMLPRLETLEAAVLALSPAVCGLDLEAFDEALAPARGGALERLFAFLNASHRRCSKELRAIEPAKWPGTRSAAALVHELIAVPEEWRTAELAALIKAHGTGKLLAAARTILKKQHELSRMLGTVLPSNLGDLDSTVETLDAHSRNASIVPAVREAESKLKKLSVGELVQEIVHTGVPPSTWGAMLQKAWLNSILKDIVGREKVLATFKGSAHDESVAEFCRLDRARIDIMAARIRRMAAERYFRAMNDNPEQKTAVRLELQKKIRQMPLRKLMLKAPDVLAAICPCYMASPLSVSQLLPAQVLFDVVIFDEGSQVLPEDAVPAIVRGAQAVIAGDPRQLPPTTFFASSDNDEDDELEDLETSGIESILEVVTPFVEPRSLTWHYRSNDERLIAFSNTHIYGGRLLTLPGDGRNGAAIAHEYVPPRLVDGQETSAPDEVRRVVELILEHAEQRPDESLGVIAMGIKHAKRIDDALALERAMRPELDEFFAEERENRFFVKNLERVQGDERDAIILSIGYGPDRSGKMVYRFGPINQAGGERRLNVAVTRARDRMTVVSSFRHRDLDPERLRSQGAKLLGAFVQYAESAGANLGREGADTAAEINAFEQDIMDALIQRGLDITPQYGVSNYRIDLAVKHPDYPGQFVLAIECDGAAYHSSPTARNRDRLRQEHLERLGWQFHRIWSTDWFYNREAEIERAVARYQQSVMKASVEPSATQPGKIEIGGDFGTKMAQRVDQTQPQRLGSRPWIRSGAPIDEYQVSQLCAILTWIESDGLLRTTDELVDEATRLMGYSRKGSRIMARLNHAAQQHRRNAR